MKFTKKSIYIGLFSVLYLIVAFSSFWHACAFFGLANNSWMSIILAFAFEIGQAAVLFSLLTSKKDRSRVMPWVLMTMFTLVQVIGNVFSSYKYIILNSVENLRFFKEPIFIWTTIPDDQATVIIVYLVGALLPIASLLLTSMITNYLSDQEEIKELENKPNELSEETKQKLIDQLNEGEESLISQNSVLQMENQGLEESNKKKDEQIEDLKKQLESRLENLHGVENSSDQLIKEKDEEIENLNKRIEEVEIDHDKMVDEKFAAERKFDDLLHDYDEQQKEFYKVKQELEELKKLENKDEQKEEKETYTITFKDGEEIVKTITGECGTYVSVPYVEKEGYEFLGWSIDGKNVTMPVDGIYDSDITYIALWKELKKEDDNKKQIENLNIPQEQVEDLIKNGIKQNKLKESHFIN